MAITQRIFITAGLVAQSEKRYDEWCQWQDQTRMIELASENLFQMGRVKSVPGMFFVEDASVNLGQLGKSTPYEPKWGKGEDFPREARREDLIEEALQVTA